MNSFCVPLNINCDPCIKNVITDYGISADTQTAMHVQVPLDDISMEFMDFLRSHNMDLLLAELFFNPPRRVSTIHVDALGGNYSKINFVYGGEKSLMCWYSVNDGVTSKEAVDYTSINTRSYNYKEDEVTLVHRQSLQSPSIVQVGVPHNIINAFKPRWCLSLVPVKLGTKQRITIEETIGLFKNSIVEEG